MPSYPADCYGEDELSLHEEGARRAGEHPFFQTKALTRSFDEMRPRLKLRLITSRTVFCMPSSVS